MENPHYRKALSTDVPFILELLREFYREAGSCYGIPFDGASTVLLIGRVMSQGVILIGPTSVAGALFWPFPYNRKYTLAQVPFWYFKRAAEITILETLIDVCQKAGATHFNVVSLPTKPAIRRRYANLGLDLAEHAWLKQIGSMQETPIQQNEEAARE